MVGILFSGMLAIGILFVAFFAIIAEDRTLTKETESALLSQSLLLQKLYTVGGIAALNDSISSQVSSAENDFFLKLTDSDELFVAGNVTSYERLAARNKNEFLIILHKPLSDGILEKNVTGMVVEFEGLSLFLGRDTQNLEIAQWLSDSFAWLMIAILGLVAIASLLIGHYVVTRINRISDIATNIMNTGNLSERIPIDSNWDDLSKLSVVLNRMLEELQDMVHGVKAVSDNIAHDLRTPLTRLRSDLEMFDDPKDKQKLLDEVDNLLSIFHGLLRISDIETAKQKAAFQINQLDVIVEDVIELYEALAEDKQIKIETNVSSCQLLCDRDLLFQAFANIVDNAIKFTPDTGQVSVTLRKDKNHIFFEVCDSGPGIPAEHKEQVTKRFYRVESSRSTAGNGLGLALVAAIVDLHQGKITFIDNHAHQRGNHVGLCACIEMPKIL